MALIIIALVLGLFTLGGGVRSGMAGVMELLRSPMMIVFGGYVYWRSKKDRSRLEGRYVKLHADQLSLRTTEGEFANVPGSSVRQVELQRNAIRVTIQDDLCYTIDLNDYPTGKERMALKKAFSRFGNGSSGG